MWEVRRTLPFCLIVITAHAQLHYSGNESPAPCVCMSSWNSTVDSPHCVNIQGCPAVACDNDDTPWCITTYYGCVGEESGHGGGWFYCADSSKGGGAILTRDIIIIICIAAALIAAITIVGLLMRRRLSADHRGMQHAVTVTAVEATPTVHLNTLKSDHG